MVEDCVVVESKKLWEEVDWNKEWFVVIELEFKNEVRGFEVWLEVMCFCVEEVSLEGFGDGGSVVFLC